MTFANWIKTFIEEKGISLDDTVEAEGAMGLNIIPVECLLDAMLSAPANEQAGIKNMLVKIDFVAPGKKPVMDFFAHIARAIAI